MGTENALTERTDDVGAAVAAERRSLAALAETLSDAQWASPSLCEGWTVGDVVSHASFPSRFRLGPRGIIALVRNGLSQDRLAVADVERRRTLGRDVIIGDLRRAAESAGRSRILHPVDPLADVLVHGQDIAIPLGLHRSMPRQSAVTVANHLFSRRASIEFGSRKRAAGLRLCATNAPWSYGDGLLVEGPIEAILLVFSGRLVALDQLTGRGCEVLRSRLQRQPLATCD